MTARRIGLGLALSVLIESAPALGTYSIVASDGATRQVGGAGTSCVSGSDVYVIYGSVPGVAAVHAQAQFSQAGRDRALQLLDQGQAPAQVVAAITAPNFDGNAASRQYGVIDVSGQSAGFTGASTLAFAGDVQGKVGAFNYSIQGNILTSGAVLTQAVAAFEEPACDLAARLMAALEAGAANGEGDSRCTGDGIPSDSAFLQVDLPDAPAGSFVSLRVPTSGDDNPLPLLRAQFDAWRATSPCPALAVDAGASDAPSDAGSPASAAVDAAVPPAPSREPEAPSEPSPGAPEPPSSAEAAPAASAPSERSGGGCSMSRDPVARPLAALFGLAALFLLAAPRLSRRRSRAAGSRA
jgi:uncharacterized Ntn-hydrolase superfamily protein